MSNRFIICGASRSGKSVLARRLQRKLEISWILGDAMVSGLEDAFPDLGISHQGDLQHIADRLTDYIKFLLWNYDYAGCGYVFESTHLYPRHVLSTIDGFTWLASGTRQFRVGSTTAMQFGTWHEPDESRDSCPDL